MQYAENTCITRVQQVKYIYCFQQTIRTKIFGLHRTGQVDSDMVQRMEYLMEDHAGDAAVLSSVRQVYKELIGN